MKTLFETTNVQPSSPRRHRGGRHALRTAILGLTLVGLAGFAGEAAADVVARGKIKGVDVKVRLHTPDRVIVHHRNPRPIIVTKPAPFRVRYGTRHGNQHPNSNIEWYRLTANDRRVAARLSLLSGMRERHILEERSWGWSWRQIARTHDIPMKLVKKAKSHGQLRGFGQGLGHGHVCVPNCGSCDAGKSGRRGGKGRR